MSQGVGVPQYVKPTEQLVELVPDNSYFLLKLHAAQAFFPARLFTRPAYLIVSSTVESTYQPGTPLKSLYRISTIAPNRPCRLGLNVNLSDWLPAGWTDSIKLTLTFSVVLDTPFRNVTSKIGELGLGASIAVTHPGVAVALKVTEVAGNLLGFLVGEGTTTETFSLTISLNVAELQTGYLAVIGSATDEHWPQRLRLDDGGTLTGADGNALDRLSYALLKVLVLPRRGPEAVRASAWGALLEAGRTTAENAMPVDDNERRSARNDWRTTLAHVRALSQQDHSFVKGEITEAIAAAQAAVDQVLQPKVAQQAFGDIPYPDSWQELLDAKTPGEVLLLADAYAHATTESRHLLEAYARDKPALDAEDMPDLDDTQNAERTQDADTPPVQQPG
jgi:hypothetical protein